MAFKTTAPAKYEDWLKALTEKNVKITFESTQPTSWMTWLSNGVPVILIVGGTLSCARSAKGGQDQQYPPESLSQNKCRSEPNL